MSGLLTTKSMLILQSRTAVRLYNIYQKRLGLDCFCIKCRPDGSLFSPRLMDEATKIPLRLELPYFKRRYDIIIIKLNCTDFYKKRMKLPAGIFQENDGFNQTLTRYNLILPHQIHIFEWRSWLPFFIWGKIFENKFHNRTRNTVSPKRALS